MRERTIIDRLEAQAIANSGRTVFRATPDGSAEGQILSLAGLISRARLTAASLLQWTNPGERALVLCDSTLECVIGLLGCLYAGVLAVPVPRDSNPRTAARVSNIILDSGAKLAIGGTTQEAPNFAHPEGQCLRYLSVAEAGQTITSRCLPDITEATSALIQYTSGSTASPKGVVVNHCGLMANAEHMHVAFGLKAEDRALVWLPLYHDLGLIGGIFQTLYSGFTTTLVPTSVVLRRPIRWLQLMSSGRMTISGGPNFSYDLCCKAERRPSNLDLQSWRIAYNGAEPVRAETMSRFTAVYADFGFDSNAFRPCYGLAEATLLVASEGSGMHVTMEADASALERGYGYPGIKSALKTRTLVAAGRPQPNTVTIVDPISLTECPNGKIGEIWVNGPTLAEGYWRRPQETEESFKAQLPGKSHRYLRTGDLGFMWGDLLYISGRLKDLIIIRGRNLYPQDIEATVEMCHKAVRPGSGAAFSVENDNGEELVIVQEVLSSATGNDIKQAAQIISDRVAEEHGVNPLAVVLIRSGTIAKTTSGKVRRSACRDDFRSNRLHLARPSQDRSSQARSGTSARSDTLAHSQQEEMLSSVPWFVALIKSRNPQSKLNSVGLDSLQAIELQMHLEEQAGKRLSLTELLDRTTIADYCMLVAAGPHHDTLASDLAIRDQTQTGDVPLSEGQRAMWFLEQLEPDRTSLNISRLLAVRGTVNRLALQSSIDEIVDRHEALRTVVVSSDGNLGGLVRDDIEVPIETYDASSWSEGELASHVREIASQPFDLSKGPLLRVCLLECLPDQSYMLFVAHHIAVDFWSLCLILDELSSSYGFHQGAGGHRIGSAPPQYATFARWQESMLKSQVGDRLRLKWRERLKDVKPPKGGIFSNSLVRRGASAQAYSVTLKREATERIRGVAEESEVTTHNLLLAAFRVLLSQCSDGEDQALTLISAGRSKAVWKSTVGCFINPVVLNFPALGGTSFRNVLSKTRQEMLEALDSSELPFSAVTEQLQVMRAAGRNSLNRVVCILQPDGLPGGPGGLGLLALGHGGCSLKIGPLECESIELPRGPARFELIFSAVVSDERIHIDFEYDSECFTSGTIADLATTYLALLDQVSDEPDVDISKLSRITDGARPNPAVKLSQPERYLPEICVHEAIEAQVCATPNAVAVESGVSSWTYAKIDECSNRLATYLAALGLRPEDRAAILLPRTQDMVIAILAVLKAGGAYVPLDPGFPPERMSAIVKDSGSQFILTTQALVNSLATADQLIAVQIDRDREAIELSPSDPIGRKINPDNLAYVMYTSGSTGKPKGVMVSHRNVINLFVGLSDRIQCGPEDALLAVTNISFDISVVELLWTLSRGCRIVIFDKRWQQNRALNSSKKKSSPKFSLFYFSDVPELGKGDAYRLLIEGAKLGDRLGFEAVWTPERHFHRFGSPFPNPAVISAALAVITERIKLRAGSVVLPLQDPIRVAEEWAVVDVLSRGRTGISFASGWHPNDFVFFPEAYERRRQALLEGIRSIQHLWRGGEVKRRNGLGAEISVSVFPRPIQPDLPVWLTSGGSVETFLAASELQANVLTHLLGQNWLELAEKARQYRHRLAEIDSDRPGTVTLMLHTYIDESLNAARLKALPALKAYLGSSVGLIDTLVKQMNIDIDLKSIRDKDRDDLLEFAALRYMESSGLIGDMKTCLERVEQIRAAGVDEVACLIDFGIDVTSALHSIQRIDEVVQRFNIESRPTDPEQAAFSPVLLNGITLLQCTPSLLRMLKGELASMGAISSLRALMIGGEALPLSLLKDVTRLGVPRVFNMYGPTETTVWSGVLALDTSEGFVPIGGPIVNSQFYILGPDLVPRPVGQLGEIYIGGLGVARGYLGEPDRTAEKFIPDPFGPVGARMYQTGDLGSRLEDGRILIAGRADQQIKLSGYRIELGDIETQLNRFPGVAASVVKKAAIGEDRLVAFLLPSIRGGIDIGAVRDYLRTTIPVYMMPSEFYVLPEFPLTPNGKIDRLKLIETSSPEASLPPESLNPEHVEDLVAETWKEVLKLENVSYDKNFFDLGGHSLLMVQIHGRLESRLARTIPLLAMLDNPTIRMAARFLADGATDTSSPSTRSSLQRSALRQGHWASTAKRN